MQPKQIRAKLMPALGCEPGSLGEPRQIEAAQGGASRLTTQQGGCNHGRHLLHTTLTDGGRRQGGTALPEHLVAPPDSKTLEQPHRGALRQF